MTAPNDLDLRCVRVPLVEATRESIADYGLFIGTEVVNAGLSIPFYRDSVVEGHNLPFVCHPPAVVRTARIVKRSNHVTWLERHLRMTQLFVGLGGASFVMVLGKPNHERGLGLPDLDDVVAFRLAPGHGVMIHAGTWHDFPMAWSEPVTVLTLNSAEVVDALADAEAARELDTGDVFKIDVARRMGAQIIAPIP